MNTLHRKLLLSILVVVASACASVWPEAPAKMTGGVLTNPAGMTLYTFDNDKGGKSMCNGPCAGNWPPLMAAADAGASGEWSIITRDDGGKQWAFKGKPLYLWSKDQKPGDMTGDNFKNVWHVVKAS